MGRLWIESRTTAGLEKQLGIKTDLAMMDDVPGFTLRLPQVLARERREIFRHWVQPLSFWWHVPFARACAVLVAGSGWLQGPDMADTEPLWRIHGRRWPTTISTHQRWSPTRRSISIQRNGKACRVLRSCSAGVDKLLKKYADAGYPYDAAMILFLHDFLPPSQEEDSMLPGIREWNAAGRQPRIIVATPAEFFQHIESTYGDAFPTYSGDWSGLWSEVKTNSPQISAAVRWTQDHDAGGGDAVESAHFQGRHELSGGKFRIGST